MSSDMPANRTPLNLLHWILAGIVGCALTGCGAQAYEQRLAETAQYFAYRERVDQALSAQSWSNFGIEFRPLKGFNEIPPPAENESDQRQPQFLPNRIPGLLAAWNKQVAVDIPNSDVTERTAWIFLCSNHPLWLERETNAKIVPTAFHAEIADYLADSLKFKRDAPNDPRTKWEWVVTKVPDAKRGGPYVPTKTYDYIVLDSELDGVPTDFVLYRYNVQDIQLALMVVAPQAIDRREFLFERVSLALEQLTMTGDIPRSSVKKPSTTAGGF